MLPYFLFFPRYLLGSQHREKRDTRCFFLVCSDYSTFPSSTQLSKSQLRSLVCQPPLLNSANIIWSHAASNAGPTSGGFCLLLDHGLKFFTALSALWCRQVCIFNSWSATNGSHWDCWSELPKL